VAPTRAAQRELEAAGYPRRRIEYLSNGVAIPPPRTPQTRAAARDLLAETHGSLRLPEGALLAVCVSGLQQGQGWEQLLAAWRPLAGHVPQARLWLAGPAPMRQAIQQQIERLQLGGQVLLTGVFDRLDPLLAAADMLVAPSPEGSPVALLEAMAAGLPVVAVDAAANRSLLAHDKEGLLVAPDDTAGLLTAMARLYKEPDLATRLGQAARARAEAEFSLATMADRHVTCFQQWAA
jgi:glycosyltransferase involved in cell wall biosynthesis